MHQEEKKKTGKKIKTTEQMHTHTQGYKDNKIETAHGSRYTLFSNDGFGQSLFYITDILTTK